MKLWNESDGTSRLNISGMVNVNVDRVLPSFSLAFKEDKNDNRFNKILLKGNVDSCKLLGGTFGNFMIKLVVESVKKYSNLTVGCGCKKGAFYVKDLPVPDGTDSLPYHIVGVKGEWQLEISLKAKVKKTVSNGIRFRIFGVTV